MRATAPGDLGRAIDVRAEHSPTELDIGPRQVDLDAPRPRDGPAATPVSRTYSSSVAAGDRDDDVRAGFAPAGAARRSTNASMPGFCSPVDHTTPAAVSAIRGRRPTLRRARAVMRPAHDRAHLAQVDEAAELAPRAGAARGDHHRGRQHQPLQVDREGSLHACHADRLTPATISITGRPSGGVGSIVGASESHRSHSTRAGLNTGPSTQDRRWS